MDGRRCRPGVGDVYIVSGSSRAWVEPTPVFRGHEIERDGSGSALGQVPPPPACRMPLVGKLLGVARPAFTAGAVAPGMNSVNLIVSNGLDWLIGF